MCQIDLDIEENLYRSRIFELDPPMWNAKFAQALYFQRLKVQ